MIIFVEQKVIQFIVIMSSIYKNMKVIVHPGYERTATSTLQDSLFGKHPDILSIGRPWNETTLNFVKELRRNDLFYNKDLAMSHFDKLVTNKNTNNTVVLSDEAIFRANHDKDGTPESAKLHAQRIKDIFPSSQVLLTIRNQPSLISGYYMSQGRIVNAPEPFYNRHITIDSWLQWCLERWEFSILSYFDYWAVIKMYIGIYGKENVHVLLYEEFANDQENFLRKLSPILDINIEDAIDLLHNQHQNKVWHKSKKQVTYAKLREIFFPSTSFSKYIPYRKYAINFLSNYIAKGVLVEKEKIPVELLDKLIDKYSSGNIMLRDFMIKKYNIDISAYDYPM